MRKLVFIIALAMTSCATQSSYTEEQKASINESFYNNEVYRNVYKLPERGANGEYNYFEAIFNPKPTRSQKLWSHSNRYNSTKVYYVK